MADVIVVGSFVQDLCFMTNDFPKVGETVKGTFRTGPGGKGLNQAIACNRQNIDTVFIGAVGEDSFGRELDWFCENDGLAHYLIPIEDQASGTASILVDEQGRNQIVVALGANAYLTREDVYKQDLDMFFGVRVMLCQMESNHEATRAAFAIGALAGATNILNPAPFDPTFDLIILRMAHIITPNETEFGALIAKINDSPAFAQHFWEQGYTDQELNSFCRKVGVPVVIITLGKDGCFVSTESEYFRVPARQVNVIDTTGAGDAFNGGLAAGLIKFTDLKKAVEYATLVASLSVQKVGTAQSMPTLPEVLEVSLGDQLDNPV